MARFREERAELFEIAMVMAVLAGALAALLVIFTGLDGVAIALTALVVWAVGVAATALVAG